MLYGNHIATWRVTSGARHCVFSLQQCAVQPRGTPLAETLCLCPLSAGTAGDHFIILHVIPTGQAASEFFAPSSPQNQASILVRQPADGAPAESCAVQHAALMLSYLICGHGLCNDLKWARHPLVLS